MHSNLFNFHRFEVAECARRLLLASVIGIVDADSAAAPVLGVFISLLFVFVFQKIQPYKKADDNHLAILLAFTLVAFFVAALMIKVDATSDSEKDQDIFDGLLVGTLALSPFFLIIKALSSYLPSASFFLSLGGQGNTAASKVDTAEEVERKYRSSFLSDQPGTELIFHEGGGHGMLEVEEEKGNERPEGSANQRRALEAHRKRVEEEPDVLARDHGAGEKRRRAAESGHLFAHADDVVKAGTSTVVIKAALTVAVAHREDHKQGDKAFQLSIDRALEQRQVRKGGHTIVEDVAQLSNAAAHGSINTAEGAGRLGQGAAASGERKASIGDTQAARLVGGQVPAEQRSAWETRMQRPGGGATDASDIGHTGASSEAQENRRRALENDRAKKQAAVGQEAEALLSQKALFKKRMLKQHRHTKQSGSGALDEGDGQVAGTPAAGAVQEALASQQQKSAEVFATSPTWPISPPLYKTSLTEADAAACAAASPDAFLATRADQFLRSSSSRSSRASQHEARGGKMTPKHAASVAAMYAPSPQQELEKQRTVEVPPPPSVPGSVVELV
jgi:hypothetical protein